MLNAAPVLDTTASPQFATVLEDATAPAGVVGTLVSALVDSGGPLANFSDADGDLPGIAITGTNLQGGSLWYSVDGGASWLDLGTVSTVAPRYLAANATTRLYFQPAADFAGTIADVISFEAWDRTGILQQLGADIDGEAAGDNFGARVSLSADGSTVAIAAPEKEGDRGQVRVYRWIGATWSQLGGSINGDAADDMAGWSVSLSAAGDTVAVGAPFADGTEAGSVRVYRFDGTEWTQAGGDIVGEAAYDVSGASVSLAADGSTIAIGATFANGSTGIDSGHVRIYRLIDDAWTQLGADIDGEATDDMAGWAISLSADGGTVAIGAPYNDGNGSRSGQTRIYRWSGSTWNQLGADIDGEAASDWSGYAVSLSADGNAVAIGATFNSNQNGSSAGHVRVYRFTGAAWTQVGASIAGESAGDGSGRSVSLSPDGQTLAIGATRNAGIQGNFSGHVRLHRWTGSGWSQFGADIDGEAADDFSGWSVSLSADGSTVAIGAPWNHGNGTASGHVRVYRLVPPPTSVSSASEAVSVTVTNANDAPTGLTLTATTVPENAPWNTVVGTLSTTDIDPDETFTYALVSGTGDDGNWRFTIDGDQLRVAVQPNFERQASSSIRVRSTDSGGRSTERPFVIQVGDVDEAPVVDHVIAPVGGIFRAGQPIDFTAVLTQPVTRVGTGAATIPLVVGAARVNATLVDGLGTNRLTFRYLPQAVHNDPDGIALARPAITVPTGTFFQDAQGRRLALALPPVAVGGIRIDNRAPVLRGLAIPPRGAYAPGDVLTFTATMSERVNVTGTPALTLTIGRSTRQAVYVSGSGTNTLVFRSVVQPGDAAPRGISIAGRFALAAGSILDLAGNRVTPTFAAPRASRVVVSPIPRPMSVPAAAGLSRAVGSGGMASVQRKA